MLWGTASSRVTQAVTMLCQFLMCGWNLNQMLNPVFGWPEFQPNQTSMMIAHAWWSSTWPTMVAWEMMLIVNEFGIQWCCSLTNWKRGCNWPDSKPRWTKTIHCAQSTSRVIRARLKFLKFLSISFCTWNESTATNLVQAAKDADATTLRGAEKTNIQENKLWGSYGISFEKI